MDEGFQMPPVKGNDGEEGLSQALAGTALDASQEDCSRTLASVAPKDELRDISAGGGVSLKPGEQQAIPLCLPNNCIWDSEKGQCVSTEEERRSLYVVGEALEQLRKIKEPVCVASIAGPYRKGKSYVLGEAFGQANIFPLGHSFQPETMGIWLWIIPGVFKDSTGQEFKLVLLDSEGIDSVICESYDDTQIFTLTVLLASILIYNSQGVPTRRDLEGLNYIVQLSRSIEVQSKTKAAAGKLQEDSKLFYKTFPFFIWLLRDVTQNLPQDCVDIKDYFLKKVFKVRDSSSAKTKQDGQKVAESILFYFSGFEAFSLPPPTDDKDLLMKVNDNKSQLNPAFLRGLDCFKQFLASILTPKKSFNEGELVTGEGLAALVQFYVKAINNPGEVPNIQNAWETFVEMKCSEAIGEAVKKYEEVMKSNLKDKRPCDNDELHKFHGTAFDEGIGYFVTETGEISTVNTEKHLNKLKEMFKEKLISWKTRNEKLTREVCNSLLIQLKEKHLEPVLQRLQGEEAAKMSVDEITDGYNQMKEDYHNSAIGAKDVIAAVFFEFHPGLVKEEKQHLSLLQQLIQYDKKLADELVAKAFKEQEIQKLEEVQEQLRQENLAAKKENDLLGRKHHEEIQKIRKQMENEFRAQKEQLNNMMEANMKSAEQDRELLMQQNRDLNKKFLAFQKANEDNMKEIRKLRDLLAKQLEEKRQIERNAQNALALQEQIQAEMEERHKREQAELRREMEANMEKNLQEYKAALAATEQDQENTRMELDQLKSRYLAKVQEITDMQGEMQETKKELAEIRKPWLVERLLYSSLELGSSAYETAKDKCLIM